MKDFLTSALAGFILGVILAFFLFAELLQHVDLGIESISSAIEVCRQANSELVSADHRTATCANRAEIPYKVKR